MIFDGKIAVVTGAAGGMGRSIAVWLAREKVKLILADVEPDALEKVVRQVRNLGVEAIGVVCDVRERAQTDLLRDRAYDAFGKVHLIFNNAEKGAVVTRTLWTASELDFQDTMAVNYFGVLHIVQSFLPRMIAQNEEAMVLVTSSAARNILPTNAPGYEASKVAVNALMEALAGQLGAAKSLVTSAVVFPDPHFFGSQGFGMAGFSSDTRGRRKQGYSKH